MNFLDVAMLGMPSKRNFSSILPSVDAPIYSVALRNRQTPLVADIKNVNGEFVVGRILGFL